MNVWTAMVVIWVSLLLFAGWLAWLHHREEVTRIVAGRPQAPLLRVETMRQRETDGQ